MDSAFETYLRTRWVSIPGDYVDSTLIPLAVRDFEGYAKRKFEDPAVPSLITVGPPNLYNDQLGIYKGKIEVPG